MSSSTSADFITDIDSFLVSNRAAPVVHREWINMPRKLKRALLQEMGEDLFKLYVYNKSRLIDRICPHCRKHYQSINTIENMETNRNGQYTSEQLEQALSGICSKECFQALNGSKTKNNLFGQTVDKVLVIQTSH